MASPLQPSPQRFRNAAISTVIFIAAVGLMAWLRLVVFSDRYITLSYGLPLLICLVHRSRLLLWAMTAAFVAMSAIKAYFFLRPLDHPWTPWQWEMQVANTLVIAGAVHLLLNLMDRIEAQNRELRQVNDELVAREEEINRQNEELQVQSEELAQQNEELQQQSEEMQQQSEELQAQSEELQTANAELKEREAMLQTMLESLRTADSDRDTWDRVCRSAMDLFTPCAQAVALVEHDGEMLKVMAASGVAPGQEALPYQGSFASVVIEQNRTAFVQLRNRSDLAVFAAPGSPFQSVLAAPLRSAGRPIGAVEIYSAHTFEWTTEHFRLIEWLAAQCSLIHEVRRLRGELMQMNINLEKAVAERTERLQEMVEELEHFSYSITHDMRAPLRAMQGFATMLKAQADGAPPPGIRNDYLGRIITAASRMDRLITDALSYGRSIRQELELEMVDAGKLLKGMVDSYPEFQPPRARIEIETPLPPILANEAGLTQCFSNLLSNAVKFVDASRQPYVTVRAEHEDGVVRIWFEDNGIGIPPEMAPRIFKMFQRGQAQYEGTGIGLALVRKVTERMGGKVGVVSDPGKGSRFWLEFRAAGQKDHHE